MSETINTDLYARHGLNYFGGDSVALHNRTNDTLVVHASTTSTARIGALIHFANSVWSGAFGAAYERTFGPQGRASLIAFGRPYDFDPMRLTGHTGIFTAKIGYRPERAKDWSFNLHLDGFVGDRHGVAGTFTTTYTF